MLRRLRSLRPSAPVQEVSGFQVRQSGVRGREEAGGPDDLFRIESQFGGNAPPDLPPPQLTIVPRALVFALPDGHLLVGGDQSRHDTDPVCAVQDGALQYVVDLDWRPRRLPHRCGEPLRSHPAQDREPARGRGDEVGSQLLGESFAQHLVLRIAGDVLERQDQEPGRVPTTAILPRSDASHEREGGHRSRREQEDRGPAARTAVWTVRNRARGRGRLRVRDGHEEGRGRRLVRHRDVRDEPVPPPGQRLHELRRAGRIAECIPHLTHGCVQPLLVVDDRVPPEEVDEGLPRHELRRSSESTRAGCGASGTGRPSAVSSRVSRSNVNRSNRASLKPSSTRGRPVWSCPGSAPSARTASRSVPGNLTPPLRRYGAGHGGLPRDTGPTVRATRDGPRASSRGAGPRGRGHHASSGVRMYTDVRKICPQAPSWNRSVTWIIRSGPSRVHVSR